MLSLIKDNNIQADTVQPAPITKDSIDSEKETVEIIEMDTNEDTLSYRK